MLYGCQRACQTLSTPEGEAETASDTRLTSANAIP
jgi:hypothetical protein